MPALILDGKTLAADTEAQLLQRVEALKEKSGGKTPILATIASKSMPAARQRSRSVDNAFAVNAMIGTFRPGPDKCRIARVASRPSSSGI